LTVADLYRALWRHRFFILILTAAFMAVAWFVTAHQQKVYEASTLVRIQERVVNPNRVIPGLQTSAQPAQTYGQIVQTYSMRQRISQLLNGRISAADINIKGSPVADLDLLWITASSPIPTEAALAANAAPRALQSFIRTTKTVGDKVVTVQEAGVPVKPARPNVMLNLIVALLIGLVLNGALALLIEVLGDPLPDTDELENLTSYPVLATIPNLKLVTRSSLELIERRLGSEAERTAQPRGHALGG
jgi:capsular polysaccharide biosynthesis protein